MELMILAFLALNQIAELRTSAVFFSGASKRELQIQDQILYPYHEGFSVPRGLWFSSSLFFSVLDEPYDGFWYKITAEPFFSYPERNPLFLHRFSSKVRYRFLAIEAGKDTIKLGPGVHNSLLLSHNVKPQRFITPKIESLELPCIGDVCLGALNIMSGFVFVEDRNYRFPDPTFWIMSVSWEVSSLMLGASRIIGFGGEGGWKPKTLKDHIDLFTARYENASGVCDRIQDEGERAKCVEFWLSRDTNQMAQIFGVVRFSELYPFDELAVYFEHGGDDLVACWQVEDVSLKKCLPIPFALTDTGLIVGVHAVFRDGWTLQAEYTWFNKVRMFYYHSRYPMVVSGRYTGAHTGPLSNDIWLKVVKDLDGLYVGGVFHITSRWFGYGAQQEKIFEFGPRVSLDMDDGSKTLGFSPTIYVVRNPDLQTDPFRPNIRPGTFVDLSLALVFITRF